ncbi:hypothetical protein K457DRAFT_277089 [Linnemannia elongata AG-77]|uniref:Phytocyanin domain-containing protein n=1 Tax=Linnemannia elongata AG-77 TaxID=1314771 RepID=A0A197K5J8_9FUNG|nr:hypothetical protein K457DRAFT_277089 [Linnemannia elongata AG-77]
MKITALSVAALFVAPALAAKTWDVNVVNGLFSPQELNIAPGDSVRWPNNDGADHAIVQTTAGARTCNNLAGGFNSGRKTKGQAYMRTFPTAGAINYKDGIGANCVKGTVGTINVGTAGNGGSSGTATATGSTTAAPITSPTNKPNGAPYLTPESSIFLGVAAFIGALVL